MINSAFQSLKKPSIMVVSATESGQRLDNFLHKHFPHLPKARIQKAIRKGEVRIDARRVQFHHKLHEGEKIRIPPPFYHAVSADIEAKQQKIKQKIDIYLQSKTLDVLFEDDNYLAINKPNTVPVHAGSGHDFGMVDLVRAHYNNASITLAHRLDKEVSGVLMFAKSRKALNALLALWHERECDKIYQALCFCDETIKQKKITLPIKRKTRDETACTDDENIYDDSSTVILSQQKLSYGITHFKLGLETGRKHQIRIHMAHKSAPIVGDNKYGDFDKNRAFRAKFKIKDKLMCLMCSNISFRHPFTGKYMSITAPFAFTDMVNLLR